jgi:lysophospholipase L1-like esterase
MRTHCPLRAVKLPSSCIVVILAAVVIGCGSSQGPAPLSHDSSLMALVPSAGALSPAFASGTTDYALIVPSGTMTVSFTASTSNGNATIAIGGVPLASGGTSSALAVPAPGSALLVTFLVTAPDGTSATQYTVHVTQPSLPSGDATLGALAPSAGAMIPLFAPKGTDYNLHVPFGTASVALTPTAGSPGAKIQINGAAVVSGQPSVPFALPTNGTQLALVVVVTAEDGTHTQSYQVNVTAMPKPDGSTTIYSIGDSTMANYDPAAYPNQRGWGQMFPMFISGSSVSLVNGGINGTSSKSYYVSGTWNMVKSKLKTGDYVFIQFGHNDEKDNGLEGSSGVSTDAWGAYHDYLTKYVEETRALGAIPVLMTPVVRLAFAGATLTPTACHDLTGNGTAIGNADYPAAMRDVAAQESCPIVDLTLATRALVESYGPTSAKSILYISADNTHLQPMGATLFAQLAAQGLAQQGILTAFLNPSLDFVVAPANWDFGTRFVGSSFDRGFSLTGLSLAPAAGNVTVTAPSGFLVAASAGGSFASTIAIPYLLGSLPPTTLYVRFSPLAEQGYAGVVTLTSASGNAKSIAVTGTGAPAPLGGVEARAFYALDSAATGATCAATGPVSCANESFTGLYVKDYQAVTTFNPASTLPTLQRVSITNPTTADTWPSELDVDASRYVEFAVGPSGGQTLYVDGISLYAGADGGNNLGFRIQWSKQSDFSAATELLRSPSNPTGMVTLHSFGPLVTVNDGETLRLRVFPYNNAQVKNRYLCLQSVTIHGIAQ